MSDASIEAQINTPNPELGKETKRSKFLQLLAWGNVIAGILLFIGYFYRREWLELSGVSTSEFPIEIWEVPMLVVDFSLASTTIAFNVLKANNFYFFSVLGIMLFIISVVLIKTEKHTPKKLELPPKIQKYLRWPVIFVGTTVLPALLINLVIYVSATFLLLLLIPSWVANTEFKNQESIILEKMRSLYCKDQGLLKCKDGRKSTDKLFFVISKDDLVAPIDSLTPRIHRQCSQTKCITLVYDRGTDSIRVEVIPADAVFRTVRGMRTRL